MKMTKGEKHHAPLSLPFSVHPKKNRKSEGEGGRAVLCAHAFIRYFCGMNTSFEMLGTDALQWAREISKLPEGYFTLCFFPYSRSRGEGGEFGGERKMQVAHATSRRTFYRFR